jgi:hypothetical protein
MDLHISISWTQYTNKSHNLFSKRLVFFAKNQLNKMFFLSLK